MGLFDRLKKGLSRTREKIATSVKSVLRIGRGIDQGTLTRLEEAMITADFGPATAAYQFGSRHRPEVRGNHGFLKSGKRALVDPPADAQDGLTAGRDLLPRPA